jgi:hypothetical protein
MLSEWQKRIKEKFDQKLLLGSQESNNFIDLLKGFHEKHKLGIPRDFSDINLLQEGGWFYVRTKDNIDMLVQMCSYNISENNVQYIYVEFDRSVPKVVIEINYKDKTSDKYDLLAKDDILEFYP